jgi:ABC-type branched-subunit amino acid transport system ATPase component
MTLRGTSVKSPGLTSSGSATGPDTIVLRDGDGASLLCIAPGTGATYRVIARDPAVCSRLIEEVLRSPHAELVPRSGGLLTNLSVLENVVLPAVYYWRVARGQLAERVYRDFDACGIAPAEAEKLCGSAVFGLTLFERRLAALVRALIMRPALLVLERAFEGLTSQDMQRVARFPEYYHRSVPGGCVIMFDLAGMVCPELATEAQVEA